MSGLAGKNALAEAERVYIVGPPGSGKSTLGRRLAQVTGLPVHDLDEVYRQGGGRNPLRPEDQRDTAVKQIIGSRRWIVEGVQLGWTDGLMDQAQVIIWLDHLSWPRLALRMTRRFAGGAADEVGRQRGGRRFLRFGDYYRHLNEFGGELRDAIAYPRATRRGPRNTPVRSETLRKLKPHGDRVIRVRRSAEVEELVRQASRTHGPGAKA
ncbi:MAG: shikimate kinase [Thermoanaerobaculia bacterium]